MTRNKIAQDAMPNRHTRHNTKTDRLTVGPSRPPPRASTLRVRCTDQIDFVLLRFVSLPLPFDEASADFLRVSGRHCPPWRDEEERRR
jgi:hypothetical protein